MAKLKDETIQIGTSPKAKNSSIIPIGYVGPNAPSRTQISEGLYSLNRRSNVPFVKLVGSAGFQKTITWGEPTVIPKGEIVTVFNASYHGGDIVLNKDEDPCNRPSRITVPVAYAVTRWQPTPPAQYVWSALFPCDVRTCKRAYLTIDARASSQSLEGVRMYSRGRRLDGSQQSANSLAAYGIPYGPGVGFIDFIPVPQQQSLFYIPLGLGAPMADDSRPHLLLDAHDIFMDMGTDSDLNDFLSWPSAGSDLPTPTGPFPAAPGTYYVVEYD